MINDAQILKLLLTIITGLLMGLGGIALAYWRDKVKREDTRHKDQQQFNQMVQKKWGELTIENTKALNMCEATNEKVGVLFKKVTAVQEKQTEYHARISKLEP